MPLLQSRILLLLPWLLGSPTILADDEPIVLAPQLAAEDHPPPGCIDEVHLAEHWLDRAYAFMNRELCEPAEWFDSFFGDPRSDEVNPVGTFFRWRNEVRWEEREGVDYRSRISGNVRLPRLSERWRLLISRDSDPSSTGLDDSRVTPDQVDRTEIGLRFRVRERAHSEFDIDAGIRGGLSPNFFTRARYRYTYPIAEDKLWRLTETAFWRSSEEGFGLDSRLDWEWLINPLTLVRWSGSGVISESSDGVDWSTQITGFRQLDSRSAVRLETGMVGRTSPNEVEEYYVNFRYRSRFLRPWLFYELQPEGAWALDDDGSRSFVQRFTFTLEIQFENMPQPIPTR